jgi:hypothetical protein
LRDDDVEGDRLEQLAAKVKDEWALTLSGRLHLDVADSFSDAPSAPHIVGGES